MSDEGARELRQCWTCRMNAWCTISHSSQDDGGQLYRCANCKAIYPEAALTHPSPNLIDRITRIIQSDPNNRVMGETVEAIAELFRPASPSEVERLREVLGLLLTRVRLDIRCGTLPPEWGGGIVQRAKEIVEEDGRA